MRRIALLVVLGAALVAATAGGASATEPQSLAIAVNRGAEGDFWSATGLFDDSGTLVDNQVVFTKSQIIHIFRTFTGSAGAFTTRASAKILPTESPDVFSVEGYWTIVSGTGAYEGLRGTGTVRETFDTAAGTVVGMWTGSGHFD
jgi:hypothetical protein